jgi:two-component system response regulator HydG
MLPDISGIDLVRSIRRARPELPVILITGYPTSENALAAIGAGASEFLPKPFTESELLTVVRRFLKEEVRPPQRRQP